MRGERFAGFFDRFDQSVAEFLISEMFAHAVRQSLPQSFATFFVNGCVADDGELAGARRDENEDSVALGRFMHSEPVKFLLRGDQRIDIYLAALNKNANLAGGS